MGFSAVCISSLSCFVRVSALAGFGLFAAGPVAAVTAVFDFDWSGDYLDHSYWATGSVEIDGVAPGGSFGAADISASRIEVDGSAWFEPFTFTEWNAGVSGWISADGRSAVFDGLSGPFSADGVGFFGCDLAGCGAGTTPGFLSPPETYRVYLNDGYFNEAYFDYASAADAGAAMRMELRESAVPEIDAGAGFGALAGIGAAVAFLRGRRRPA